MTIARLLYICVCVLDEQKHDIHLSKTLRKPLSSDGGWFVKTFKPDIENAEKDAVKMFPLENPV